MVIINNMNVPEQKTHTLVNIMPMSSSENRIKIVTYNRKPTASQVIQSLTQILPKDMSKEIMHMLSPEKITKDLKHSEILFEQQTKVRTSSLLDKKLLPSQTRIIDKRSSCSPYIFLSAQ